MGAHKETDGQQASKGPVEMGDHVFAESLVYLVGAFMAAISSLGVGVEK